MYEQVPAAFLTGLIPPSVRDGNDLVLQPAQLDKILLNTDFSKEGGGFCALEDLESGEVDAGA